MVRSSAWWLARRSASRIHWRAPSILGLVTVPCRGQTCPGHPRAQAARRIERAVDAAYGKGVKPSEFGGRDGTMAAAGAVMTALDAGAGI
jgi:hypothetical protein